MFDQSPHPAVDAPLIDRDEIRRLQVSAARLPATANGSKDIAATRAGEQRGMRRGSGMDYDDSRPYQPGDDPRSMNWRLSARTGALQTKLFREERRPTCCVLLDRRDGMAFGTRRRLKVTQAARVACLATFAAVHAGEEVAALLLESSRLHWVEPRLGEQAAYALVRQFAAARRPPASDSATPGSSQQPPLAQALALLRERLEAGTRLLLVSDFSDLDAGSRCAASLNALCAEHQVTAVQIVDPAEQQLPRTTHLSLVTPVDRALPRTVDCSDPDLRRAYEHAAARHFSTREELLRAAGAAYRLVTTSEDDIAAWLSRPHPD